MKINTGKIIILTAAVFTGFLIINSIDLNKVNKTITSLTLNTVDYKKAIEERNQLYKDIDNLKKINSEIRSSINQYDDSNPEKSAKLIENMKNQLLDYGALSGIYSVKGPGLIIKLEDGDRDELLDTESKILSKILHEQDIARVLNEIKNAGAEAIAINDHRILTNTAVSCYGAFIGFEDESSVFTPFYIYVIGNPEEMKAVLLADNSVLKKLMLREIKVDIEEKEEIVLPATTQNIEAVYMERYETK